MAKLRYSVDCSGAGLGKKEISAQLGDLAVVRLRDRNWTHRFVVGAVSSVSDEGRVQRVATARQRPSWEYHSQIYVVPHSKLDGRTAEQVALALPLAFDSIQDVLPALMSELGIGKGAEEQKP